MNKERAREAMRKHGLAGVGAVYVLTQQLKAKGGILPLTELGTLAVACFVEEAYLRQIAKEAFASDGVHFWDEEALTEAKTKEEKQKEISRKRAEAARARWKKKQQAQQENETSPAGAQKETSSPAAGKEHQKPAEAKTSKAKLVCVAENPPTTEEVQKFLQEKGADFTAERFLSVMNAKGWHYGKTPICDWQACALSWISTRAKNPEREEKFAAATEQQKERQRQNAQWFKEREQQERKAVTREEAQRIYQECLQQAGGDETRAMELLKKWQK